MIFGALIDSSLAFFLLAYFVKQNDIAYGLVSFERERSESLLQNMLPSSIAARLKDGTEQVANRFDEVSVLFADMVGLLNEIFTEFDSITLRHGPRATGWRRSALLEITMLLRRAFLRFELMALWHWLELR